MINSMTTAEKLRFLADRMEDEKEFYMNTFVFIYQNGVLMQVVRKSEKDYQFIKSGMSLDSILSLKLKLKPQWVFTEDEKAILRNLPDDFQWITRDASDWIYLYATKPTKGSKDWGVGLGNVSNLWIFNHLFQCIQWSDDEPCEFRKYL